MLNRSLSLDAIRSAAIALVLLSHAIRFAPLPQFVHQYISPAAGIIGVELFFALSGFLIGRLLLKANEFPESRHQLLIFWFRRWMRTLPVYFMILPACIIINIFMNGDYNFPYLHVLNYISFTQNFTSPHPEFLGIAWSLAIEEWSYILIPLILFLTSSLVKMSPQKLLLFCSILLIAISIVIRFNYSAIHALQGWDLGMRKIVIFRFDAVAYGLIAAVMSLRNIRMNGKIPLFLICAAAVFYWLSGAVFNEINFASVTILPLLISTGFASLVLWLSNVNLVVSVLSAKVITQLSLCSYSLYLIHSPLWELTLNIFPENGSVLVKLFYFTAYIILSVVCALIMYQFIEKPVLTLRDKLSIRKENHFAKS